MVVTQRLAGLDGLLVVTVSLIALLYSNLALRIVRSGMNLALGALKRCRAAVLYQKLNTEKNDGE